MPVSCSNGRISKLELVVSISSVQSESRPDSSHQKACLLEISHLTARWRRLLYRLVTRLLPRALKLFVNGLVSLCRLCGSCCA